MALDVTLKKNSSKKGIYKYNNDPEKEIQNQSIPIEKEISLKLWLEDNGHKDSKLLINPERVNEFEIRIEKLATLEWQLTLLKGPTIIPLPQRKHKETGHNHGCGEEPSNGQGVTVTIGEP